MTDDAMLAARLAANLAASFECAVCAYQDRLFAFALRLCADRQDAEEITQDAFVRAYRALARYPADRVRALALRPWLYRIVLNVWRNRAQRRRLPSLSLDAAQGADAPTLALAAEPRAQPEAVVERSERQRELARALRMLPEAQRIAILLRHMEGMGYREMARLLGQPEGTVKAHVHRGLARLRALAADPPIEAM